MIGVYSHLIHKVATGPKWRARSRQPRLSETSIQCLQILSENRMKSKIFWKTTQVGFKIWEKGVRPLHFLESHKVKSMGTQFAFPLSKCQDLFGRYPLIFLCILEKLSGEAGSIRQQSRALMQCYLNVGDFGTRVIYSSESWNLPPGCSGGDCVCVVSCFWAPSLLSPVMNFAG